MVHHKYYTPDTEPWDYEDDCYQTVCKSCHKLIGSIKKRGHLILPVDGWIKNLIKKTLNNCRHNNIYIENLFKDSTIQFCFYFRKKDNTVE